jgi:hypothetical protein
MEKIKVILNRESNTLGEEVILKKDKDNRVIGFEKLKILSDKKVNVPIEVMTT